MIGIFVPVVVLFKEFVYHYFVVNGLAPKFSFWTHVQLCVLFCAQTQIYGVFTVQLHISILTSSARLEAWVARASVRPPGSLSRRKLQVVNSSLHLLALLLACHAVLLTDAIDDTIRALVILLQLLLLPLHELNGG